MLMSQAKIYWDLDNYAQVEKVSDNYELLHARIGLNMSREGRVSGVVYWDLDNSVCTSRRCNELVTVNR